MTNFNDKFIPNIPKTFQVLELRDQQQEQQQPVKKSPLSPAARAKVINRSGSNYLSKNEDYGPCSYSGCPYPSENFDIKLSIEGNRRKWAKSTGTVTWLPGTWETGFWTSHYESSWNLWLSDIDEARRAVPLLVDDTIYTVNLWGEHCAEDRKFCNCALEVIRKAIRHHENGNDTQKKLQIDSDISKWSRFVFTTGAAIGTSFLNPVAAAGIGAATWGIGKAAQEGYENDRAKAFWGTIADMGFSSFSSGAGGKIDKFLGKLTNNSGGFYDWAEVYKKTSESKLVENITGPLTDNAIMHVAHQTLGYSYHSECLICNP